MMLSYIHAFCQIIMKTALTPTHKPHHPTTKGKDLRSIIICEGEINHESHQRIIQASRKREANIKKELRMVILKNIETFYSKVYHNQALEFKPISRKLQ